MPTPTNPPVTDTPYNLSFTAAALRPELARIVAEAYRATGRWDLAKKQVLTTNALQSRNPSSLKRMETEFRQRLQLLDDRQLDVLIGGTAEERAAICWLAVLKKSSFALGFASTVLRDKLENLDPVIRPSDYEDFIASRAHAHPELASLSEVSKKKIEQVLYRMLAECGIMTVQESERRIGRPVLPSRVVNCIAEEDPTLLAGFLVPESEISRYRRPI